MAVQADSNKRLIAHVQGAHVLEQSVLRLLDAVLSTSPDEELHQLATAHKAETEQHEALLRERLGALGSSPSRVKQIPTMLTSKVKGAGVATEPTRRSRTPAIGSRSRIWRLPRTSFWSGSPADLEMRRQLLRPSRSWPMSAAPSAAWRAAGADRRRESCDAGASVDFEEENARRRPKARQAEGAIGPCGVRSEGEGRRAWRLARSPLERLSAAAGRRSRGRSAPGTDEVTTPAVSIATPLTDPAAMPEPITRRSMTGVAPPPTSALGALDEPLAAITPVNLAQMTKSELVELAREETSRCTPR